MIFKEWYSIYCCCVENAGCWLLKYKQTSSHVLENSHQQKCHLGAFSTPLSGTPNQGKGDFLLKETHVCLLRVTLTFLHPIPPFHSTESNIFGAKHSDFLSVKHWINTLILTYSYCLLLGTEWGNDL